MDLYWSTLYLPVYPPLVPPMVVVPPPPYMLNVGGFVPPP